MMKRFLVTTALVALTTGGAYAQEMGKPVFTGDAQMTAAENGYFTAEKSQILATNLLGAPVYHGGAEDQNSIGEVNDVVFGPNGTAEAVVIGVGGFIGIGEKDVAIDFERLSWTERDGGERWLMVDATKEELESAPAYERTAMTMDREDDRDMAAAPGAMEEPADEDRMADAERTDPAMEETADEQRTADAERTEPAMEETAEGEMNTAADPNATRATDQQQVAAMDPREGLTPVDDASGLSSEELIGATVYGADNNDIGEIGDVIVTKEGQVSTFVIDVGGFLGIGEKPVAVGMDKIEILTDGDGNLSVFMPYTDEELEAQPEYTAEAYQADPDGVTLR